MHYCSWYDASTATTPSGKKTDAIANIKQFYAFVINGVGHGTIMNDSSKKVEQLENIYFVCNYK